MSSRLPRKDDEITWPALPWSLSGTAWFGWCTGRESWQPTAGLTALRQGRGFMLSVLRLGDDPQYDEFVLASPVRRGLRVGMFARHCWVSTAQAAAAKKALWNLDAQVARFAWTDQGVAVTTAAGSRVKLRLSPPRHGVARFAPRFPAPGLSVRDGVPLLIPSTAKARFSRGLLVVDEWAHDSLPELSDVTARFAASAQLAELLLRPPRH